MDAKNGWMDTIDGFMDGYYRWMDAINGWIDTIDGWMDGCFKWMDGWMNTIHG